MFVGAGEGAPVVDLDAIAVLGLPIAFDGLGDFNLELGARGQGTDGGGGHQTEGEEDVLHYRGRGTVGGGSSDRGIGGSGGRVFLN